MMNENAESLAILQEAFQGSLEPEIVHLILTESNDIVEDALEKLLALSTPVVSTNNGNNGNPCSVIVNKLSTTQSSTAGTEDFSQWNGFEAADRTCTSGVNQKKNKTRCLGAEEQIDSQALNLSLLSKSQNDDTCSSAALSGENMLIDSADKSVNCPSACTDSEDVLTKENLYLKTKPTTANGIDEFGNSLPTSRKPAYTNDSRFKDFVQQFKSRGTKSDEWSSVSKPKEIQAASLQATLKSKENNKREKIIASRFDLNSNNVRTNLRTAIHNLNTGIEVTDHPLSLNKLPPWPDYSQGYLHQVQPVQTFYSYGDQRFPLTHNFPRGQNPILTGNAACLHSMPQYQHHQNMPTYNPYNQSCTRNDFYVPDPQNQPIGWHPGLNTKSAGNKKLRIPKGDGNDLFPHGKVLVILRGLPGSGKTTLGKNLKGDGIILSTDDYFIINGQYQYKRNALAEAHEWNKKRAQESMERGLSPVIIDNTNTQAWEMRPYVSMAQSLGYWVILKEPDTPWKWDPKELVKRNQHSIPLSTIHYMKERYEKDLTVESILTSSLEKQKVPSIHQTGHFNKMEIQKLDKELKDIHKERNSKLNVKYNSAQEPSSPSDINRGEGYKGTNIKKQLGKEENNQPKNSVSLANLASNQLGNQCETKMFHNSKANFRAGTLRSHGSRSPIQDMDFSLPELPEFSEDLKINKSLGENDTLITKENFMETLQPKQQRIPKKRERNSLRSPLRMEKKEDDESPNILDCDQANDINLCVKEQKPSVEGTGNSVKLMLDGKENGKNFNTETANVENSLCITDGHARNATTEESIPEEAHIRETILQDLTMRYKSQSDTDKATVEDDDENDRNIPHRINDGSNSSIFGSDLAETNDLNESFKTSKIPVELWNGEGKEEESVLENFKSESEQNGFQFLNTCFPDMDVQILLDVLAKEQGDVTKAVESILRHKESHCRFERNSKETTSNVKSSLKPSIQTSNNNGGSPAYSPPDQNWKSSKALHFPEIQTETLDRSPQSYPGHAAHDQTSFQMMLEPPVALHLLELFGPIDNVNLEGDFSTENLIVEVDFDFAKLLYNQWRTTKRNKEKFLCTGDVQKHSQGLGRKESFKQRSKQQYKKHQLHDSQEQRQPTDLKEIMDEQLALEHSMQEQEYPDNSTAPLVLKRKKLYSAFPGADPLALEELFEANRYKLEPTVSMVEASCSLQANAKPSKIKEIHDSKSQSVSESDSSPREQKMEYQVLQDPDYVDFRAEADTHYKLRDECFRKAAFAFSKKQGQLAQFYASQGHMHTQKIRQANKRAADKILEFKNSERNQNSLDLHGLHVNEALLALEERLHFSGSSKNQSSYLSIITGQGKHSKQGKAKIKPAVLEYLQRNNYRFEEPQPGLVRVSFNK